MTELESEDMDISVLESDSRSTNTYESEKMNKTMPEPSNKSPTTSKNVVYTSPRNLHKRNVCSEEYSQAALNFIDDQKFSQKLFKRSDVSDSGKKKANIMKKKVHSQASIVSKSLDLGNFQKVREKYKTARDEAISRNKN